MDENSPFTRYRLSDNAKIIVPLASELWTPLVGIRREKPDLKSSDKEVREQRKNLAKAGPTFIEMLNPARDIQTLLRYPGSSVPQIAKAPRVFPA